MYKLHSNVSTTNLHCPLNPIDVLEAMEYIEIKKENLIKAYEESCEDVRQTLEKLFPELVNNVDIYVDDDNEYCDEDENKLLTILDSNFDYLAGRGFLLHNDFFEWELINNEAGDLLLIPTRR